MADFGFVGASYEAPTIYQDAQECINWYPEIDPVKPEGSRGVIALLPTPGYQTIVTLPDGPVRGMRAINPFGQMVAVAANKLYVILADWSYTEVGTLITSTDPLASPRFKRPMTGLLTALWRISSMDLRGIFTI
jgi:hypothetical protein